MVHVIDPDARAEYARRHRAGHLRPQPRDQAGPVLTARLAAATPRPPAPSLFADLMVEQHRAAAAFWAAMPPFPVIPWPTGPVMYRSVT